MNPRKLVVGTAAAGGGLILLTTLLFKDEIHDWLYAIRRVRTWGDLLAQEPIRLSDGVVVRLGIEDTRCPQGSGVLLYCIAEGYDPGSRDEVSEAALGPLEVAVVEEDASDKGQDSSAMGLLDTPDMGLSAARWLLARSIPAPSSGRYRVTVSEGDNALRHVIVEETGETFHPWLTLEQSPRLHRLAKEGSVDEKKTAFLGTFLPCRGDPALPSRVGYVPYMDRSFSGRVDPARPLPRLFPDPDAPAELDLRREGDSLAVTSRSKIHLRRENFAVRWWINDMPHVPKDRSGFGMDTRGSQDDDDVEQFRLEIDFDASRGELRSGDRVSLQLMYSDQSWSLTDGGEGYFRFAEEHRVLESNPIELTVP